MPIQVRSRRFGRKPNVAKDVEMQSLSIASEDASQRSCHMNALKSLFDLSDAELNLWPGARVYCRSLEESFKPLTTGEYSSVWILIGGEQPTEAARCWPWFNAVISTLRKLNDEESSMEDVCKHLAGPKANSVVKDLSPSRVALFSVLCWDTMVLQPCLNGPDGTDLPAGLTVRQEHSNQPTLKMDAFRRPIPAIFRQFRRVMPNTRWRHPIVLANAEESVVLHAPSLNYASLHTIGKINLIWVDDLTSHLDFDASERRLSVFKFPSFCALSALADGKTPPVLSGLIRALYVMENADKATPSPPVKTAQLHQEILMSYRLLFGQSLSSRHLVRKELNTLRINDGDYDKLLDIITAHGNDHEVRKLPASLWPVTCRNSDGILQEDSAYSAQDDFPLLGGRLVKLQEFSLRQQPSKLRDLWRDRRNPLQWYTFWAVLIFGGVSIIIGALQLLVAIAQVVLALPSSNCSC